MAELFSFLSIETAKIETKVQIVVTHHKDVLCNWTRDTKGLAPCTQALLLANFASGKTFSVSCPIA